MLKIFNNFERATVILRERLLSFLILIVLNIADIMKLIRFLAPNMKFIGCIKYIL